MCSFCSYSIFNFFIYLLALLPQTAPFTPVEHPKTSAFRETCNFKDYPFLVSIWAYTFTNYTCSGSYLGNRWVLTSASCVDLEAIEDEQVRTCVSIALFHLTSHTKC